MSCVWILQSGHSGDGCVLASALCKYNMRKGNFCSELGKGATSEAGKSLFRAARDNRCMYMAHVCFYVCCSDCVGVCGNVCCIAAVVKNIYFFKALEC